MKLDIPGIIEGFRNSVIPPRKLKKIINETAAERLSICLNCPFNSSCGKINQWSRCKDCGCFLTKKAKCLSCSCPQEKWKAVATDEQEQEIDNLLEKNGSK